MTARKKPKAAKPPAPVPPPMTHIELRATYPSHIGVEPTICPGEVDAGTVIGVSTDDHEVIVFACALCGHRIVVDAVAKATVNDYHLPRRTDADRG
jgi:hypothetical protein